MKDPRIICENSGCPDHNTIHYEFGTQRCRPTAHELSDMRIAPYLSAGIMRELENIELERNQLRIKNWLLTEQILKSKTIDQALTLRDIFAITANSDDIAQIMAGDSRTAYAGTTQDARYEVADIMLASREHPKRSEE